MVWDTAGQEEFDAITKAYYRGRIPECVGVGVGEQVVMVYQCGYIGMT